MNVSKLHRSVLLILLASATWPYGHFVLATRLNGHRQLNTDIHETHQSNDFLFMRHIGIVASTHSNDFSFLRHIGISSKSSKSDSASSSKSGKSSSSKSGKASYNSAKSSKAAYHHSGKSSKASYDASNNATSGKSGKASHDVDLDSMAGSNDTPEPSIPNGWNSNDVVSNWNGVNVKF